MFPDVSEFPKGQNGDIIYGGSIGSNKIFDVLRETAGSRDSPLYDLWLINVYTLLRNAYVNGISQVDIEKVIDTDVDLFMTYISAYMSYRRPTPGGVVLFYAPDYNAIPKMFLRNTSGQKQRTEIDTLYTRLLVTMPNKLNDLTEDPMLRKYLVATSRSRLPHRDLPGHIRAIYGSNQMRIKLGTVLISHCQIDLHLNHTFGSFDLLDSFTGVIRPPTLFGQKLVKEVSVPFNTTTHRAFGDDVHLEPLFKGKRRTELIELARDRNWAIRTEREIVSNITETFKDIEASDLLRLRL